MSRHRRTRAVCTLLLVLTVAGCGDDKPAIHPASAVPRYEVDAMVLADDSHGPQLCAGVILTSAPPQCGGPDLRNFDWSQVAAKETVQHTTTAQLHLVGTYDAKAFTFTLTEPPGPARPQDRATPPRAALTTPCPTPAGGWQPVDPAKASMEDQGRTIERARAEPDSAGVWLANGVLNLAFTGDLARHEREIRTTWGGPLCVSRHDHSLAALMATQECLNSPSAKAAHIHFLESSSDEVGNVVIAQTYVADDATRNWIEEHCGKGVVLSAVLRPVA
jgi:hypothetical protein